MKRNFLKKLFGKDESVFRCDLCKKESNDIHCCDRWKFCTECFSAIAKEVIARTSLVDVGNLYVRH